MPVSDEDADRSYTYPRALAKLRASPRTSQTAHGRTVASGCTRTDSGFRNEYRVLNDQSVQEDDNGHPSSPSALLAITKLLPGSQQNWFIALRAGLNKALGTDVFKYDLAGVHGSSGFSMQGETVEDRLKVASEEFAEEGYFVVCMGGRLSDCRHQIKPNTEVGLRVKCLSLSVPAGAITRNSSHSVTVVRYVLRIYYGCRQSIF